MLYKRGDIITFLQKTENSASLKHAVIMQADWFNIGQPPSYITCTIASDVYPELDFRPTVTPDGLNNLPKTSQIQVDKVQIIKPTQIEKKVGHLDKKCIKEINGCLKAILGL